MKFISSSCIFSILFTTCVFGQTFQNEPTTEEVNGEEIVLDSANVSPEVLANLGFETGASADDFSALNGNLVSVQQIGQFNDFTISASTQASDINVLQQGNSNRTTLLYNVESAITSIQQLGDFNLITDFVNNPTENVSLDLQQQGDNLTFERFGTNSITESLRFIQTEASPAIIIRSFQ